MNTTFISLYTYLEYSIHLPGESKDETRTWELLTKVVNKDQWHCKLVVMSGVTEEDMLETNQLYKLFSWLMSGADELNKL